MAKTKTKTNSTTKKKSDKTNKTTNAAPQNGVQADAGRMTPAEFVSKNAIPLGMVAAGIGILAARNISGGENTVTKAAARGRQRLAALAETGRGKAGKKAAKLRQHADTGIARSKKTVTDHPVAAGVAAAAVGAGLAVAVPKLIDRAKS